MPIARLLQNSLWRALWRYDNLLNHSRIKDNEVLMNALVFVLVFDCFLLDAKGVRKGWVWGDADATAAAAFAA